MLLLEVMRLFAPRKSDLSGIFQNITCPKKQNVAPIFERRKYDQEPTESSTESELVI